jgi:hypothetical protein
MNFTPLQSQAPESLGAWSPEGQVTVSFAFGAGAGAWGTVNLLTAPPFVFGGPKSALPVWNLPMEFKPFVEFACFTVCGAAGAVVGWRIGKSIQDMTPAHPNVSAILLFVLSFVPMACGLGFSILVSIPQSGITRALGPLVAIMAIHVWTTLKYRRSIGRENAMGIKPVARS